MRQRFLLALHLVYAIKDGKAFGKDGASGEREASLREIAALNAALLRHGAVIKRVHAGEDFEQRGFAGTVRADQSYAVMWRDEPVEVLEKDFWAKALPGCRELNH